MNSLKVHLGAIERSVSLRESSRSGKVEFHVAGVLASLVALGDCLAGALCLQSILPMDTAPQRFRCMSRFRQKGTRQTL